MPGVPTLPDGLTEQATSIDFPDLPSDGTNSSGPGNTPATGFYRVINVTPFAVADYFAVNQDSSQNELNILQNDFDPNDDYFEISNVQSAHNGQIQYYSDGTMFQYTPNPNFYGIDTFIYTIMTAHGGVATATGTICVNKAGNNPPTVGDLTFILNTNEYAVSFNAITNSSDADGDTNILFALTSPRGGTVSGDLNGNVTYSRNPEYFGSDSFTYFVTDGNGGFAKGTVIIRQASSSSDKIPDQWKLWYGIDMSVDSSTNDLDGDGLPNLAEFQLGTNPLKRDNPLNLTTITNGLSLTEYVQFQLTGMSPMISVPPISLYMDGSPTDNSHLFQGPNGRWFIGWDTSHVPNGIHQIQVAFEFNPSGTPHVVYGEQKTVQITNRMTFDKLTSKFSDTGLFIDATVAAGDADVDIELYDEGGYPLAYASTSTSGGRLQLYWDLTDGYEQICFGSIQALFYLSPQNTNQANAVTADDTLPNQPVHEWWLREINNPNRTGFVVAWGWDQHGSQFDKNRNTMMLDGVVNILGNPSDINSYFMEPYPFNTPLGQNSFRFDTQLDKAILLAAIKRNSFFFWLGHGGANNILGDPDKADISSIDVADALENHASTSTPKHPQVDKHPYKLAIFDGCRTYSDIWPKALGIDPSPSMSTNTVLEYQLFGRSPRAFVGFTNDTMVPTVLDFGGIGHAQFGLALGELFGNWMGGAPLDICMDAFADKAENYGFHGHDSWCISGCYDMKRFD